MVKVVVDWLNPPVAVVMMILVAVPPYPGGALGLEWTVAVAVIHVEWLNSKALVVAAVAMTVVTPRNLPLSACLLQPAVRQRMQLICRRHPQTLL